MTMTRSAHDIDAAAARWAVRVDAGTITPDQRLELDAWLETDPRHRGAFLRARAGLRLLDHGRVVRTVLPLPEAEEVPPKFAALRPILQRGAGWGLAAMAAGVAIVMIAMPSPGDFRTGVGEQRRVALQDGSVAMINTDSQVDVAFAESSRRITLSRGEAWFQVAKDHARPFVVDAGDVHVRATGTAFSVRRRGEAAQVIVTEGRVLAWVDGASDPPLAISAGEEAILGTAATISPKTRAARADDALAWRKGEIVLNGETVAAAADEFNRYNDRKIRVRNTVTGNQTIVGYFLINQPKEFATAAARMTRAKVKEDSNEIVIE